MLRATHTKNPEFCVAQSKHNQALQKINTSQRTHHQGLLTGDSVGAGTAAVSSAVAAAATAETGWSAADSPPPLLVVMAEAVVDNTDAVRLRFFSCSVSSMERHSASDSYTEAGKCSKSC